MIEAVSAYKPFGPGNKYEWMVEIANRHELIHWTEIDANLSKDVAQWQNGEMSDVQKQFVVQILRLFTQTDVQVASNYCDLFLPTFQHHCPRQMLLSFAAREGIHARAYSLLNDTLGLPDSDYRAFLEYEEMVAKVDFMQDNNVSTPVGVLLALAQATVNEGMSLFSAFAMLMSFQKFGLMKGMGEIVEWSVRDEEIHVEGMAGLFRQFVGERPHLLTDEIKAKIYQMHRTAIDLEDRFIDLAFAGGDPGLFPKEDFKTYTRLVSDIRLNQIGFKKNYNIAKCPDGIATVMADTIKGDFFAGRITQYSRSGLSGETDWGALAAKYL